MSQTTAKRPAPLLPEWPEQLALCLDNQDILTDQELSVVRSMRRWRGQPTDKQAKWLEKIYWAVYVGIEE
jgi:hypothetical protein